MGPRRPSALGRGPPPGRRGSEPSPLQPPLQGAHHGQGLLIGELASQHHADQTGTPTGVGAAQVQSRLHKGFRRLRCRGPTTVIGGHHRGFSFPTEALNQRADGAWGEAQGHGDGGAVLTVAEAPPDGLADGYRNGTSHGMSSDRDEVRRDIP